MTAIAPSPARRAGWFALHDTLPERIRDNCLTEERRENADGHPDADAGRTEAEMATRTLTLEVPEELITLLGSPEATAARAKQALVLDLLREVRISQGQAADFLGITRWDILDLMAQYDILSGPETPEDVDREIAVLERLVQDRSPRAHR
jgi:hypothetical protein